MDKVFTFKSLLGRVYLVTLAKRFLQENNNCISVEKKKNFESFFEFLFSVSQWSVNSSRTFFSYHEPREKAATRRSSIALVNVTTAVSAGIERKMQDLVKVGAMIPPRKLVSEQRVGFTGGIRNISASYERVQNGWLDVRPIKKISRLPESL